jgi:hypothetical protein
MGAELPLKTGPKAGICEATAIDTRKPKYIAVPPAVGVGRSCTRRSSGMTSNEWRLVRERTTNVVNHVARAATAKTMMYSRNRIKRERSQWWYRASAARCLAQG